MASDLRVQITTGDSDVGWNGIAHLVSNRTMARASDGRLWVVWEHRRIFDTDGIRAAYSDDDGATWTIEVPLAGVNVGEVMSLVLDSSDVPMIIYIDEDSSPKAIRYLDRSGGSWNSPELVYEFSGDPQIHFAAIDSGNAIHIAFADGHTVKYITGSTGSWSGASTIHTDGDFPSVCAIAVTLDDDILVMFGVNTGDYKSLYYDGSWNAAQSIHSPTSGWSVGTLVIRSNGTAVAAYKCDTASSGTGDIHLNVRGIGVSGVWSGADLLVAAADGAGADDMGPPALGLDANDFAYIIYQEDQSSADDNIYFKGLDSGNNLGSEQTLDSTSTHPNTKNSVYTALWHQNPALGGISPIAQPVAVILSDNGSAYADLFFDAFSTSITPTVETQNSTDVTGTTATGNGNIESLGSSVTAHGHCWDTSTNPTTSDSSVDNGAAGSTGAFTSSITGLSAGTLYYARAFVTNSTGTAYGANVSFIASAPTVITLTCKDVVGVTATGRGDILHLGGSSVTAHGHCWDTSSDPDTGDSLVDNGAASATGGYTSAITGLTPGTVYYTRAFATNSSGTSYGANVLFTAALDRAGIIWMEGSNFRGFDENAIEGKYIRTADVDDAPVNGETEFPISSNWAFDHVAAADPHVGYVLESLFDAQTVLHATSDDTPVALTVTEQTLVGRLTGGNIAAVALGIADNNVAQID
ncbi:hypothetical protein LCGC14_1944100, partial [marine sediment metagenome]